MYVVKRPFRDFNGMNTAGSIIGPADIKRFKSRLAAGHIVEVNEQNFDDVKTYVAERFGVVITKESLKEAKAAEAIAAAAEAEPKETADATGTGAAEAEPNENADAPTGEAKEVSAKATTTVVVKAK